MAWARQQSGVVLAGEELTAAALIRAALAWFFRGRNRVGPVVTVLLGLRRRGRLGGGLLGRARLFVMPLRLLYLGGSRLGRIGAGSSRVLRLLGGRCRHQEWNRHRGQYGGLE